MSDLQRERFWRRVNATGEGCWNWLVEPSPGGYGVANIDGRSMGAHRAAWILTNGPIPPGMNVLHTCDNRICVRPAHLFLGTQLDNVRDMDAKGRRARGFVALSRRGERHYGVKVTDAQVRQMREDYAAGAKVAAIARGVGLSRFHTQKLIFGGLRLEAGGPIGAPRKAVAA